MLPNQIDLPSEIALQAFAFTADPDSFFTWWGGIVFFTGIAAGGLFSYLMIKRARRVQEHGPRFEVPFSRSPQLILARYEPGNKLASISPGIESLTGAKVEDLIQGNDSLLTYVHELDQHLEERAAKSREESNPDSLQYQYRIRSLEGKWRWMHVEQAAILDDRNRLCGYETISQDITDQYQTQMNTLEQLKLQKLRSSALEQIVSADDLPVGLEPTLRLIKDYFPLEHAGILHIDLERHVARSIIDTSNDLPAQAPLRLPITGEIAECWIRRIHGGEPMLISPETIQYEVSKIRAAFADDIRFSILIVPLIVNGKTEHALILQESIKGRQWSSEERSVLQTIAQAASRRMEQIAADTERENFSRLRRNLERSESIAHLTSGIVHDFNNLIFAISGRVTLLQRRTDDPNIQKGLDEIRNAVSDASNVIKRLLNNDASDQKNFKAINPWEQARQVGQTAERLLPSRTRLDIETTPAKDQGDESILANPQTIQQLTLNLVVNARDAAGTNGHIRLSARLNDEKTHFMIQVEDNGPGIPPEQYESVMKPFVSNKNGTGLGLSICRRVVEEAGGTIVLGQSPLGGLMATASFPLSSETPSQSTKGVKPITSRLEGAILVVEDNDIIRDVLVRSLESAGASVTALDNAINVEKTLAESASPFNLMIFDIDLPERTGVECLKDLRNSGNLTPCLLITGGTTEPPAFEQLGFLRKPFRMDTLLECCGDLIEPHEG